jgi:4-amino-4-deoxy-L-arabinose transferase-like glycosyltransferase
VSPAAHLSQPRTACAALGLALLIAGLLRISGLGWGLPTPQRHYPLHPDEPIVALAVLRIDLLNLQLNPGMFNYGSLSLYLDRLALDAMLLAGQVSVVPDQPAAAARLVGETIRVGRWVTALLALLTVLAVGLLGGRLYGPWTGALAALLLAAAPLHLAHSHYNTVDVPAGWWCTLCLFLCAGALKAPARGLLAVAGVCAGLAASTKYNAGIVLLAPLYTLAATWRRPEWHASARAAALLYVPLAAAGAFLLTTPGVFLDPRGFWRDFSYELWHSGAGHGLVFVNTPPAWIYHAVRSLPDGLGWPLTLAAAGGVGAALVRRRPADGLLLSFILPYYLLIGGAEIKFTRYLLPIIPPLLLLAARLLTAEHKETRPAANDEGNANDAQGAARKPNAPPHRRSPGRALRLTAAALVVLWTAAFGIAMAGVFSRPDPRDQAAAWIRAHRRNGDRVALLGEPWFYTPPLAPSLGCTHALARACGAPPPDWLVAPRPGQVALAPAELDAARPTFLLASEFEYGDPLRLQSQTAHSDATTQLMDHLKGRYHRVRTFRNRPVLGPLRWFQHHAPVHDLLYPMPDVHLFETRAR